MDISRKAMSRLKYFDIIVYGKSESNWKLFGIYLYKKWKMFVYTYLPQLKADSYIKLLIMQLIISGNIYLVMLKWQVQGTQR